MNFYQVRLQTNPVILDDMQHFYHDILGLSIEANHSGNKFTIQAGQTRLTFQSYQQDGDPFYHFAFNIRENHIP